MIEPSVDTLSSRFYLLHRNHSGIRVHGEVIVHCIVRIYRRRSKEWRTEIVTSLTNAAKEETTTMKEDNHR